MKWEDYPRLSRWADIITRVIIRGTQDGEAQRKWQYGSTSQSGMLPDGGRGHGSGVQIASRSWKKQGSRSSPRTSSRDAGLPTP